MSEKKRVVSYINQFYAQYGGEEAAGMGIVEREGPVGPGVLIEKFLGDEVEVVATVVCGDNYITEDLDHVVAEVVKIVASYKPDLFIAGPGFNAGRYGIACGAVTAAVRKQLKIPAVTGLFAENPGAELYSGLAYIIGTNNSARRLAVDMEKVVRFAAKLLHGEPIGNNSDEGYLGTGPVRDVNYSIPAPKRALDMALAKFYGKPFITEVPMPNKEIVPPSKLTKPLSEAKIALVTDGGLVPKGNPDRMVPVNSLKFAVYSIAGKEKLLPEDYEVKHQGYDNSFVLADPNRLVPVDAFRELQKRGIIGTLYDEFYTTAGVMTTLENAKKFGKGIADKLREANIDAVILTST